jgi:hypothetical protein
MKLRAIRLTNVRRFAGQTAAIEDLGDGLSVIAAPNESGKSTIFDALHALFFAPHGSRARDIVSLQPHAGGRVQIAADIDLPEGRFRLDKAFLSRPAARVTDLATGRIIAQDDAAEAWAHRLTGQTLQGPAGLLWVRQGATTLDPATNAERDRLLATRRDLLSTVAGEIDLMTGGRRMDRVRDACLADLAILATASGKPKSKGPWQDTRDDIAALDAEIATLTAQSRALATALSRRREIADRLTQLDRPEARAARAQALDRATAALATAEAHAARLSAATQAARIAALTADEAARRHAALAAALAPLPRLAAALQDATRAEADLAARAAAARAAEDTARATADLAARNLARARAAVEAARRAAAAREADSRRAALAARLAEAETQTRAIAAAETRIAATPVTDALLAGLDRALAARATAQAAAAARAVTLTLRYDGTARVTRDGAPLPAGDTPLTARATLVLPGIGALTIDPGAATADPAALAAADTAVARALAACAAPTRDAAQAALRDKSDAQSALALATALLRTHAPEGLPALRAALAAATAAAAPAAPDTAATDRAAPDTAPESVLALAEAADTRARVAAETARAAAAALADPLAQARAALTLAQTRLAEAAAAAGDPATRDARLADLATAAAQAATASASAEATRDALARAAPDLATAQAELARARSAQDAAARETATLREEQARLAGAIQTQADLAVDERLADRHEARAAATEREARLAAEVAALTRLASVLDDTRLAAREAYFGPVQRELAPLLAILADDAALTFDADSLLPGALARAGGTEPLATLSGGTQEQIAILTRLAFARLFARAGQPVPVILDDALVHTDDARILRMFTALHRVAADQQVIVFTCRQMVFESLGGARPLLTVTPA